MTQSTPDHALLEALGLPDPDDNVFPSRSAGTRHALRSLRGYLRRQSLSGHVSSPTALWQLLHDTSLPPRLTWGAMATHTSLDTLLARLALRRNAQRPRLLCWNLRRLVNPEPQVAKQKLATLLSSLRAGNIVLLQETHWSLHDLRVWSSRLEATEVHSTCGVPGPRQGLAGGVAILVPPIYNTISTRILCPGYAVEVVVARGTHRYRLISVYLPPTTQADTWARVHAAITAQDDIPHYIAGDFNLQLTAPRDGEADLTLRIRDDIARLGCALMPHRGPTRWGRTGPSQIDHMAVPRTDLVHSQLRHVWRCGLSDHASLQLLPAPIAAARSPPTLTPYVFKHLPTTAITQLRLGFATLEKHYGIPEVDLSTVLQPINWESAANPESLPTLHPFQPTQLNSDCSGEVADSADPSSPSAPLHHPPQSPGDSTIPLIPRLMRQGHQAMSLMIRNWWTVWSKSRSLRSILSPLYDAVRHNRPLTPSGPLAAWMTALQWDGEPLTAAGVAHWIGVAERERAQRRSESLTPWQRGPGASRPALAPQFQVGRQLLKRINPLEGVRNRNNRWVDAMAGIDHVLYGSRDQIWPTVPPGSHHVRPIAG